MCPGSGLPYSTSQTEISIAYGYDSDQQRVTGKLLYLLTNYGQKIMTGGEVGPYIHKTYSRATGGLVKPCFCA